MKNEYKNSCVLYILRFCSLKPITQSWQTCKLLNDDANNNLGHLFLMSNVSIQRNGRESLLVHVFWGTCFVLWQPDSVHINYPRDGSMTGPTPSAMWKQTGHTPLTYLTHVTYWHLSLFFLFSLSLSVSPVLLLSVVSKMSVNPVRCWLDFFFVKSFFFWGGGGCTSTI